MGMPACLSGGHSGQMKRSNERSGYISYCAIKLIVKVDKQVVKSLFHEGTVCNIWSLVWQ